MSEPGFSHQIRPKSPAAPPIVATPVQEDRAARRERERLRLYAGWYWACTLGGVLLTLGGLLLSVAVMGNGVLYVGLALLIIAQLVGVQIAIREAALQERSPRW